MENLDNLNKIIEPNCGPKGDIVGNEKRATFGPKGMEDSIGAWIRRGHSPTEAAEQYCLSVMLRVKNTYRNFKWYDKRNPKAVGYCNFSMDLRTIFRDVCKNSSILLEAGKNYDFAYMPIEDSVKGPRPIAPARLYYAATILEKLYDSQDEGHRLLLEAASACKTLGQMYYNMYFAARADRRGADYTALFDGRETGYVEREYQTQLERERWADSATL